MVSKNLRIFGILFFTIGFLMGLVFWGSSVWADLEASLFRAGHGANQVLYTIQCPLVITPSHSGTISMQFTNPTDRQRRESVRAFSTYGARMLISEVHTILPIEPGGEEILTWPVYAEDAAWNSMVLFRVIIARSPPFDSRTASCGVMVINLPQVSGNQITGFMLLTSILGMAAGIGLSGFFSRPLFGIQLYLLRIMAGLAGLALVGMGVSILGQWLLGGLLFIFTLLFTLVAIAYLIQH